MAKPWKKKWQQENAMSEEKGPAPTEFAVSEEPPVAEAAPAAVEEPKVVVDPKKRATHPPVTASPGQACQVEGCGYIFGDPVFGTEPHPTELVTIKPLPKVEPPRPVPPPRPESTAKCEPVVGAMNTCPTCGWNAKDSLEPHPVTP